MIIIYLRDFSQKPQKSLLLKHSYAIFDEEMMQYRFSHFWTTQE